MQLALVDGVRVEPFKGGRANCPMCQSAVVAKCGSRVVHHWSHLAQRNCDPWWENETQWHRDWKNRFPVECREVSHVAPDGEIHRSDVKSLTGIYIEFQHSPMSDQERASRENFYKNLVWVIDGSTFASNFHLLHWLPDPDSEIARDVVWIKGRREWFSGERGCFWRVSENPGFSKLVRPRSYEIHGVAEIEKEVEAAYRGHHQFDWVRPRSTWLDARCPVFLDFGEDYLLHLTSYDEYQLPCVRLVAKRKFLHDVSVEVSVSEIATRFYPLPKE